MYFLRGGAPEKSEDVAPGKSEGPRREGNEVFAFGGLEVTVHITDFSLLLSTSAWVLLSPPIERRETRPTA